MKSESYLWAVGRFLLALIFVVSGIFKIVGWGATAGYMASKGLPMIPVLLALTILVEVGCGALLMIGYRTHLSALALFLYLIPVTLIFHDFWAYTGMDAQMQMVNFLKNLSIMGGLLVLAAPGPVPVSVDAARARRHPPSGVAHSAA